MGKASSRMQTLQKQPLLKHNLSGIEISAIHGKIVLQKGNLTKWQHHFLTDTGTPKLTNADVLPVKSHINPVWHGE